MMSRKLYVSHSCLVLSVLFIYIGCGEMMSEKSVADGDWSGGEDDPSYTNSDADADTDTDADADADDNWRPEQEVALNYIVPQGAGRYVFIPDEAGDSVVIVDSETLEIRTVRVGSRPFHLVSLNTENETTVAVLNLNSDDVTVVRMDETGTIDTTDISVRPDTNALAPSPNGRFVIAYHNPLYVPVSGAPGTDQEISVLDITLGKEKSFSMAVGMRPWKVEYNEDSTRAFVVTEGGINVIDLENLSSTGRASPVSLFESGTYNSQTADIEITPDGSLALGRKSDSNIFVAAPLDGSGEMRTYALPSVPSDLDISEDGSFGVLVMRDQGSIALFDLPLPEDETANPFEYISLEGRTAGLAVLSSDGNRILLYTTASANSIDRRRLTLLSRTDSEWDINSAVLERSILAVAAVNTKDGAAETAVVMHEKASVSENEKPFGYSLVTLPEMMTKLQQLSTEPGQLLLTPDGAKGFLLLPNSSAVEKMDLDSLIVNQLALSSPPTAAGYAASTNKVFIAQNHTAGRMSFIGVDDNSLKTVTGYNLNDAIETTK